MARRRFIDHPELDLNSPEQRIGKFDCVRPISTSTQCGSIDLEKEIKGLAGRLGNPNFADKAPPEVVAECKANLADAEAQAALARKRLADLR